MSADPKTNAQPQPDRLEVAADEAIAACGGDMRSAIRALILANEYLEHEVKDLMMAVSKGYSRSRKHSGLLSSEGKDWYD